MTARDWVIDKLLNDSSGRLDRPTWTITHTGDHGFTVQRPGLPDAYVCCPEGANALFTTAQLDHAVDAFPAVEFVVLLKRRAASDVYPYAYQRGIALGRLGELRSALEHSRDISQFVARERSYVQSRLDSTRTDPGRHGVATRSLRRTRAPAASPDQQVRRPATPVLNSNITTGSSPGAAPLRSPDRQPLVPDVHGCSLGLTRTGVSRGCSRRGRSTDRRNRPLLRVLTGARSARLN